MKSEKPSRAQKLSGIGATVGAADFGSVDLSGISVTGIAAGLGAFKLDRLTTTGIAAGAKRKIVIHGSYEDAATVQEPDITVEILGQSDLAAVSEAVPRGNGLRSTRAEKVKESCPLPEEPKGAAFIVACLAPRGRLDEYLGDAAKEYNTMLANGFSWRAAQWYYRVYVLKTAIGLLPSLALRIGGIAHLLRKLGV